MFKKIVHYFQKGSFLKIVLCLKFQKNSTGASFFFVLRSVSALGTVRKYLAQQNIHQHTLAQLVLAPLREHEIQGSIFTKASKK